MAQNEQHPGWGGSRGGGRPVTNRNVAVTIRISQEAADILSQQKNKSEFIDTLIKQSKP
jgi:hypothetical protein